MLINKYLLCGVSQWQKFYVSVFGSMVVERQSGYEIIDAPAVYTDNITYTRGGLLSGDTCQYTYGSDISTGAGYAKDVSSEVLGVYNGGALVHNKLTVHKLSLHQSQAMKRISETYIVSIQNPQIVRAGFIALVNDTDPNAYPINGIHTDGFYYIKQ